MSEHPEKALRITQLVLDSPALLGRYLERQTQWQAGIATVLSRRTGQDPTDLRTPLAASVALSAFHTAWTRWAASDGARDLAELVDEAFDLVAPALDVSA
jgi:hypothetical protein